ncbi:MAG: translocation/assembly module TamB domain-containing protein [Terriglobales bacterium]
MAISVLIGIVGGYFFLNSGAFRRYALRKIEEDINQTTGARTRIGGLDLSLPTLTAQLHNIVVRGTEGPNAPPLLQVDELTVRLKIQSVFRHQIGLRELLIEHPVVHVLVDRQGKNNVPLAPPNSSSGHTSIFDLAINRFGLTRGELYFKDKKVPLEAALYDLQTHVGYSSLSDQYSGTISYSNGQIFYAGKVPWSHSLQAQFTVTPSEFSLQSAVVKLGSSSLSLHARVANFTNPTAEGNYEIRIHAQDFSALSPNVRPAGDVHLAGRINYRNSEQSALRNITVSGQIESAGFSAAANEGHLEIRRISGHYELVDGTFRSNDFEADSLGGRIRAEVSLRNLDTTQKGQVRARISNVSLREAQNIVYQSGKKQVTVSGLLNGTADAEWTGSFQAFNARSDLNIRGNAEGRRNKADIPVDAIIHAAYNGANSTLLVRQTSMRTPFMNIAADGEISNHSSLQIHAQAGDLQKLIALVESFRTTQSAPTAVSGAATLDATVQGSLHTPRLSGQLHAQNLHVEGSDWKSAALSFTATPSQVTIFNASLVNQKEGRASFDAKIALRQWAYLPSNSVHANLSVQQMRVSDLQHLAKVQYPVDGELSAQLVLNGTQLDPAGSGSINMKNAHAYGEAIQTLAVKLQAANGIVKSSLNVATSAGSAVAALTYTPRTKAYKIKIDAPAIALQKVQMLQKNGPLSGTLSASANGEGTLDDPELNASIQLSKVEVQQKSLADLKAGVQVANKRANFTLDSQISQASVRGRGHVDLTGNYQAEASIDTGEIPLGPLLATFTTTVPQGFQGQTELHATLKGPLKDKALLEAHVKIPTLTATYQQLQIAAAGPISADFAHSVLTLQPAEIRGTGTSLRVQGSFPFGGSTAPNLTAPKLATPTLAAQGSVDLHILRMFEPDIESSGTVALDVHATGSPADPAVQGQVRLQDVAITTSSVPLGIEKLNGELALSNDRLQISSMNAEVGGGEVSLGGSVVYRPQLEFAISLQGKSVRLRYPAGLRTLLDTNLALSGNMQSSSLNGRVLIDSLSFTPDFDLSTFADQFTNSVATPAQPGFADTVRLAVAVQSKQNLSTNSSQVSVEGDVDLNVIGTAANPVITGRTDLTSGELFYRSTRYKLEHGVITFADPNQTSPNLNVSVSSTVEQYKLTINLRGTLDRLTTSYVSDPPLATTDIIHLIAFGNTSSESAANSASQSTDSMLASSALGTGLSSGIQQLAGLSSLQIDPLLGGDNQDPGARIALQQRVSKNFLFTFSTDVSQPGQELVQGDYQINKRWSVTVTRDQLGGVSVAGRLHTKF